MKSITFIILFWSQEVFASSSTSELLLGGSFIISFLILVYFLPVWLTLRVKKLLKKNKLTKLKLTLHVLPAIVFGCWGLSDLLNPDYFEEATIKNYVGMIINIVFVYLGVTTYQRHYSLVN